MLAPGILFYDVVLAIHIIAVVVSLGVTFAYPFMDMAARRNRLEDLAAMHRFQVFLTRHLVQPGLLVVLVAGLYMAVDRELFSEVWVTGPMVIIVVLFGMIGAIFAPTERRMAELAERDLADGRGQLSPDYQAQARKLNVAGPVAGVLIMLAIFMMTTKIFA